MDNYKLTYKLVKMIEISLKVPEIVKFIEDNRFMKKLDLDMIYDEYKSLFKNPEVKLDAPPQDDDELEEYRSLKEKVTDLKIKALTIENHKLRQKFKGLSFRMEKLEGKIGGPF